MTRKSVIFAAAAALAMLAGGPGLAQSAPSQPRYATQIPPSQDAMAMDGAPSPAPTIPVETQQAPPVGEAPQMVQTQPAEQPAPQPDTSQRLVASSMPAAASVPPQPRYATMQRPADETVTVTGLRPSDDSAYRLGTGDKVRVTVFGEEDLSGEFDVDSQGYVRLPLVGQVRAIGLTTYVLEAQITDALVNGGYLLNPRVNVEVTTYRPFTIMGEVAKPGEYPYVNAMNVPNAIALAGGYTDRATERTVLIRHQGDPQGAEVPADETTRVEPGDVVRVERSTYWAIMTILAPIISPFSTVAYLLK